MSSADPADVQAEMYLRMGPAARVVAAKTPAQGALDALTADLSKELQKHQDSGRIAIGATVHYVSALP